MGLDIVAYSNIVPVSDDLSIYSDEYLEECGFHQVWRNEHFPEHAKDIDFDWFKLVNKSQRISFRAGSYGGYNMWRSALSNFATGVGPYQVWTDDSYRGWPFHSLIKFSDCEGVIGPAVSKSLYDDFLQYRNLFQEHYSEYELATYKNFTEAFRLGADNGIVIFC